VRPHHIPQAGEFAQGTGLVEGADTRRGDLGLGQLLQQRPRACPVAVGEALQRGQLLRRGLGGEAGVPRPVSGRLRLGAGVALDQLGGQPGIVDAGRRQRGRRLACIAPGGQGLGPGGPQPPLQRAEQLGLAVVGHLALADQRHLELRLQPLDQRRPLRRQRRHRLGGR